MPTAYTKHRTRQTFTSTERTIEQAMTDLAAARASLQRWLGEAKRRFGPSAFYCSHHYRDAAHLGVKPLTKTRKRIATAVVKEARP